MYAGLVVEQGEVGAVFARPLHPYTRALLDAVPEGARMPLGIPGVVPSPHAYPTGCRFAPRCPRVGAACTEAPPPLEPAGGDRAVRCIRWDEP